MLLFCDKLKKISETLRRTGFYSVFLSNVFAKILTFFGGVIIVRVLSKSDYGLYTYVMNCYSILFILNDFGCNVASMQFRSENHDNKELYKGYFIFPFKSAILFCCIAAILIFLSPYFYPFTQEGAKEMTRFLCFLPFLTVINSFLLSNLRVEMKNRKFALLNFLEVLVHYGIILPFSYFWNVSGAVVANYAISFIMILISLAISKDSLGVLRGKANLTALQKKRFIKYAFASQINNSIGTLLNLFDVFLIGLIIADSEVISSYKIASTIPSALMFIPNSILVYAGPLFARHINNKEWVKRNYLKMVGGLLTANGLIMAVGILFSSFIILLVYGQNYMDAVPCFIILMINYFFAGTFQIPSANIIYTQHKVRINIVITVISNFVNCILDVILIRHYGSIGAAFATLAVSICASAMAFGYMWNWIKR